MLKHQQNQSSTDELISNKIQEPIQLLRIAEVSKLTTIAKSTINLWVAQGKFPKPIHLSSTIKVWRKEDLNKWIKSFKNNNLSC